MQAPRAERNERRQHVGVIGGDEHERDTTDVSLSPNGKLFSHPKLTSRQAISICRASIILSAMPTNLRRLRCIARGRQNVLKCVCHQVAVFDNQYALAFQGGTPRTLGKWYPHGMKLALFIFAHLLTFSAMAR